MIGALLHWLHPLLQTPCASPNSPDPCASEPLWLHTIVLHCGTFPDWQRVAEGGTGGFTIPSLGKKTAAFTDSYQQRAAPNNYLSHFKIHPRMFCKKLD